MKNIVVLFLLTTYLFSSTNWNIGVHECGGEKSYSFCGLNLNFKCECDHSDKEHKNCCSDDTILLKADNQDKIFKKDAGFKKFTFEYLSTLFEYFTQVKSIFQYVSIANFELPTGHSPPLYILFQVFRI